MKKFNTIFLILLVAAYVLAANNKFIKAPVVIQAPTGTTAALEVISNSSDQGVIFPKIASEGSLSATEGMLYYDTGLNGYRMHNGTDYDHWTAKKIWAQLGATIGDTSDPDASALLDIKIGASPKGMLPPRMTTAQKDGISSPATGLFVYDTTLNLLQVFNATSWVAVATTGTPDNDSVSAVKLDESAVVSNSVVNVGFTTAVGSSALTVALVGADGAAFSATNVGLFGFRNVTITTGTPTVIKATAAPTDVVISSGSTLGFTSAKTHSIYIYEFNDGGTLKTGVSQSYFDCSELQSSTADDGAGGSDTNNVIYTPNGVAAVTSKACLILGKAKFSLTTAGTWDEVGDKLELLPINEPVYLEANTTTATAVTQGNAIPFDTEVVDTHSAYVTSTSVFTFPLDGVYSISVLTTTAAVTPAAIGEYYSMRAIFSGGTDFYGHRTYGGQTSTGINYTGTLNFKVDATKDETLTFQFLETIGAVNLDADATHNNLQIVRVGP